MEDLFFIAPVFASRQVTSLNRIYVPGRIVTAESLSGVSFGGILLQFTASVRKSVGDENWYAAVGMALTLPDICGRLQSPGQPSSKRYIAWCDTYLVPRYTMASGHLLQPHIFLTGSDCYALRCAFLHEGRDDIIEQRAREAIDSFAFLVPYGQSVFHCNSADGQLQLQADIFCLDMCEAVEQWLSDCRGDLDLESRIRNLMHFRTIAPSPPVDK